MSLMRVQFSGSAIGMQTNMTVILPQGADAKPPYPTLYLLHGLSDDDSIWTRRTSIERYVDGLPLVVVMPDGGRGFYTDAEQGFAYESHIMDDVIGFVERFFPVVRERGGRVIGGLSMGGYGSMKLALKHPDVFCSVVSHSSAFSVVRRVSGDHPRRAEMVRLFGEDPEGGPNDIYHLAESLAPDERPAVRFDCGSEDGLIEENRAFHAFLDELGFEHEYAEHPGSHNWAFWDEHVQEALAFHRRVLGI